MVAVRALVVAVLVRALAGLLLLLLLLLAKQCHHVNRLVMNRLVVLSLPNRVHLILSVAAAVGFLVVVVVAVAAMLVLIIWLLITVEVQLVISVPLSRRVGPLRRFARPA